MNYLTCSILIPVILLFACGCDESGTDDHNTRVVLETLGYPNLPVTGFPDTITNVEMHGGFWQDYCFAIRFNASSFDIEAILDSGYAKTEWKNIEDTVANALYGDDFDGRWRPDKITTKDCYFRDVKSGNFDEELILVIDREKNLVYGVGHGAGFPGP